MPLLTGFPFAAGVDPQFAHVSGTTGSPIVSSFTRGPFTFDVYTFEANGSITLDVDGPVDYLIVGAAGRSTTKSQGGQGGGVVEKHAVQLTAGTYPVTVGTAYSASSSFNADTAGGGTATVSGSPQSNPHETIQSGTYNCKAGAGGAGQSTNGTSCSVTGNPFSSDITGTPTDYAGGSTGAYGRGDARTADSTIASYRKGVVIIRVMRLT